MLELAQEVQRALQIEPSQDGELAKLLENVYEQLARQFCNMT